MSTSLLQPPITGSPQTTLHLSQQAPSFLKSQSSWSLPYPLSPLFNSESQEKWASYENILLACLRSGDTESAQLALEQLTARFGAQNERIMALQGLYQEAVAKDQRELEEVLRAYEDILKEDPTLFTLRKRRAALLRSMGRTAEAVAAVKVLLEASPTDAEAWAELADLYLTQGLYEQAIYCLEEVLLVTPNAWNMHARLGEVVFLSANRIESGGDQLKQLSESMRRFCRSVELCNDYLRGYYGLKLVTMTQPIFLSEMMLIAPQSTTRLLDVLSKQKKSQPASSDPVTGDLAPPSIRSVEKLNELATSKLVEILRHSAAGDVGWDGYSQAELIAAQELLDRDTPKIQR